MKKLRKLNFRGQLFFVLLALFTGSLNLSGQSDCLNSNGSFETINTTDCVDTDFAFNHGCVPGWGAANGSPGIVPQAPSGGGNNSALMLTSFSSTCYNEALKTRINYLTPGVTYSLTFMTKTNAESTNNPTEPINLRIYQAAEVQSANSPFAIQTGLAPCADLVLGSLSQLVYEEDNVILENWTQRTVCFTALDLPKPSLVFFPEKSNVGGNHQAWIIDQVCIKEFEACTPVTDLTACPAEGSYGFIHFDCDEKYDYDWSFPASSSAIEVDNCSGSTIIQADPGSYSVVISGEGGCSTTENFEITADCCYPCETPVNLACNFDTGKLLFTWDAVATATSYEVQIIFSDPICCLPHPSYEPTEVNYFSTTNSFQIPEFLAPCLSIKVKAICGENASSEFSAPYCWSYGSCFDPAPEDGLGHNYVVPDGENQIAELNPRLFPNPTEGSLNLELKAPGRLSLQVAIYSAEGKLIKTFAEEEYPDGNYKKQWNMDSNIPDGLYYVIFNTNYGTYEKKLVISQKN